MLVDTTIYALKSRLIFLTYRLIPRNDYGSAVFRPLFCPRVSEIMGYPLELQLSAKASWGSIEMF